jgi:predicted Rossmann-fold nucleotide-binding protein
MAIERRKQMTATKPREKAASRTANPSRTVGKKGAGKKKITVKKSSSPGMFSKFKHMVGAVLMGAVTGAMTGAVKGAVEAGGNEVGIPKESEPTHSLKAGIVEAPGGKEPKKHK